jgi:predicted dehydrogenase
VSHRNASRRTFLQQSAAAAALGVTAPYFFSAANVRADEAKAESPSDRPLIGAIGCGGQGSGIAGGARGHGDIAAVCDVDRERAEGARAKLSGGKAEVYTDYRKLLDRKDIDVVTIGTPDHWHSKIAVEAMQSGKDVYCEKPLTLTIDEGKQILKVLRQTNRVFQVGTQQRSGGEFQKAVAIAHSGRLGKIHTVTVAIGGGPGGGPFQKTAPPSNLDWNMWLGQAPLVDYIKERCHYQFRWWFEYSGGKMTDWGAHHVDIAHWALGANDTGPVSFEGTANFAVPLKNGHPTRDDFYNTATTFRIECKFADGATLIIADKTPEFGNGILIEGDQGRIFVARGKLAGKPVEDLAAQPLPADAITKVYKGKKPTGHMANFFECVKNRSEPISDVLSHHRAMTTCHLANIAIRLGRPIKWDPSTEQVVGDEDANSWQKREQRKGFEIVV